jgi:hypothetical protein
MEWEGYSQYNQSVNSQYNQSVPCSVQKYQNFYYDLFSVCTLV